MKVVDLGNDRELGAEIISFLVLRFRRESNIFENAIEFWEMMPGDADAQYLSGYIAGSQDKIHLVGLQQREHFVVTGRVGAVHVH